MSYDNLHTKIKNHKARICVIGLGQVGLPTALIFSKKGYSVLGYDINKDLLNLLLQRKSPFEEAGLKKLISNCIQSGKFEPNGNLKECIEVSDIIIVCVAIPTTNEIKPNLSFLENACKSLSELKLDGKLIIIESSIPPGSFKDFVLPIITKKSKLGKQFWAVYVPERLSPGQALNEIQATPRIIGSEDKDSGALAKLLYQNIVNSTIFITNSKVAELSKLVENSYRDVNIAFANEISIICEKYGIDFAELVKVCNSHPRVNLLMAGPGVGGPCLPKDPYLLLNPIGSAKIESRIILESRKINDHMPHHVSSLVKTALQSQGKTLEKCTIIILGTAYKGNVSDTRFSPSEEIIKDLKQQNCEVLVYDPLSDETFGGKKIDDFNIDTVKSCDAVVVVTDHDKFKNFDLKLFQNMKKKPIVVDTKRIFDSKKAEELGINYISVGYNKGSNPIDIERN